MKLISKFYHHLASDSLYRNSIYLMASTVVMAFFGFFFWIINARLFTPEQVGIGTTLISVMNLISTFSLLGLGNSLIMYLPGSERKNAKINTAFTLAGLAALAGSLVYLALINRLSPQLSFIRDSLMFTGLFVAFVIFSTLNILLDTIFIAYRSSVYVLLKNTILSMVKLVLPFLLVALGAYGIFMSFGVATAMAFVFCLVLLAMKFNYVVKPTINPEILKRMTGFSLGTYAAGFIGGLPAMVLPILITNSIGARFSAYFYMDMMIANILYIIPLAVSQSLFAEGSYNETDLKTHLRKALKIISLILVPGILATMFLGKFILLAFGKQYSGEGIMLLQLFATSSVFVSINSLGNSILFIKHRIKLMILVNVIGTATILVLTALLSNLNLTGIGMAWIIGQGVISVIYMFTSYKHLRA